MSSSNSTLQKYTFPCNDSLIVSEPSNVFSDKYLAAEILKRVTNLHRQEGHDCPQGDTLYGDIEDDESATHTLDIDDIRKTARKNQETALAEYLVRQQGAQQSSGQGSTRD